MKTDWIQVVLCSIIVSTAGQAAENQGPIPKSYKLVCEQNFQKPDAIKDFVFSDPNAWKISTANGNDSLELFNQSKYNPKHRSPFNIALLADKVFGDFILDVELQSTVQPYNHQDMCLFFGFEARTNSIIRISR